MIAGVGYNAIAPNARTPDIENIDWQDMSQKRANLEKTKAEIVNLKKPKEKEKKDQSFSDIFSLSAVGAFEPDIPFLNETKMDVANFVTQNMDKINEGDAKVEMELKDKVDKYQVMLEQSKEWKGKYADLAKKKMEGGYLDTDEPFENISKDVLEIETIDANGNPIKMPAGVGQAKSFEDYQNTYKAREQEYLKPFKAAPIEDAITKNWKLLTDPTVKEVELNGGKTQITTAVTADEARNRLQNLWNNNKDFQRQAEYDFKMAKKNTPDMIVGVSGKKVSEIKDSREFVVEQQLPVIVQKDVKLEGTEKFDTLTKIGNNKARIGNVVADYYNDGKGNWTIDMSPYNKQTKNPPLEFKKPNGQMALGTPVKWEGGDGKTPVLVINEQTTQAMRDNGSPDIIETRITYSDANQANLKYFDPYEAMQVLGVSGNQDNLSVKTPNTKPEDNKVKTVTYTNNGTTYNIPIDEEAEFKKSFPNAKKK